MIDKFGKVMIYVGKPRAVADFWVEKIGFTEIKVNRQGADILSVALTPNRASDAAIELFDKKVLEEMAPEMNSGTPSICFSSYDIADMRGQLIEKGVEVGDVVERAGVRTFTRYTVPIFRSVQGFLGTNRISTVIPSSSAQNPTLYTSDKQTLV